MNNLYCNAITPSLRMTPVLRTLVATDGKDGKWFAACRRNAFGEWEVVLLDAGNEPTPLSFRSPQENPRIFCWDTGRNIRLANTCRTLPEAIRDMCHLIRTSITRLTDEERPCALAALQDLIHREGGQS